MSRNHRAERSEKSGFNETIAQMSAGPPTEQPFSPSGSNSAEKLENGLPRSLILFTAASGPQGAGTKSAHGPAEKMSPHTVAENAGPPPAPIAHSRKVVTGWAVAPEIIAGRPPARLPSWYHRNHN
jgi:hypothetical protein